MQGDVIDTDEDNEDNNNGDKNDNDDNHFGMEYNATVYDGRENTVADGSRMFCNDANPFFPVMPALVTLPSLV